MTFRIQWLAICLAIQATVPVHGGVIYFTDKSEWIAATGAFTTLTFVEFPDGTVITDQYEEFGILFTDGNDTTQCCDDILYPNDGYGLVGGGGSVIHLSFLDPQAHIAIDFFGVGRIDLFSEGELVYSSSYFSGGFGSFAGFLSTDHFDAASITANPSTLGVFVDDLHYGVPAPSGLVLLCIACLGRRRRAS